MGKLTGLTILLTEDNPDCAFLTETILKLAGARVEVCSNGGAVLRRARSNSFDAVLLDIELPDLDGFSVAKTLRDRGYTGPIIAYTAHAFPTYQERAMQTGFTDFISKPVDNRKLVDVVAKIAWKFKSQG